MTRTVPQPHADPSPLVCDFEALVRANFRFGRM